MKAELIRNIYNLKPKHQHTVLTIGNFDGVHRGHQSVLAQAVDRARQLNSHSMAIIFEPQPYEYFYPQQAKPRLFRLREKYTAISACGVDYILCLAFNKTLAQLSAQEFIRTILIDKLALKHLIVGDDFHFGAARGGDYNLLTQYAKDYHFTLEQAQTFYLQEERVSSTKVREALKAGDLILAEQLLGHPYGMLGRVAHGNKRGREFGFPTANIYLHRKMTPIAGVYAVKIYGLDIEPLFGVANVGNRPTVEGNGRTLLEVNIFNFNQDIYGKYVKVDFIHKIRDEMRYDSIEVLKTQINQDVITAKHYFGIKYE